MPSTSGDPGWCDRHCCDMREVCPKCMHEQTEGLRETLEGIGAIVGVTKDSPPGERSVTVAVHALARRLDEARELLRSVLAGEDILTDREWKRSANRIVGE